MFRITKQADYGVVLLSQFVGLEADGMLNAKELSGLTRIPLPMVGKILKQLARDGLLASQRGAHGGYSLARRPEDISLVEIIDSLEGPVAVTACCGTHEREGCHIEGHCRVRVNWRRIGQRMRAMLGEIRLADMVETREACGPRL